MHNDKNPLLKLIEQSGFGYCVIKKDGFIVHLSSKAAELLSLLKNNIDEIPESIQLFDSKYYELLSNFQNSDIGSDIRIAFADYVFKHNYYLEEDLYHVLIRNITEFEKVERELVAARKLEAIGIFAGGVAHDYNNALTAILGNLSLAKMEIYPDQEELLDIITDAESASKSIKELTDRLSLFARASRPQLEDLTVANIIDDLHPFLRGLFNDSFSIDIKADSRLIKIDKAQVVHAFERIIENSLEAKADKLKIIVNIINNDTEKRFHELYLSHGEYLKIAFLDNGEGINPDSFDYIFDPYFTTKEMHSGLGLAIAYSVMKRHKGFIEVANLPEGGTAVILYFPIV